MRKYLVLLLIILFSYCSDNSAEQDNSIIKQIWDAVYYPQTEVFSLITSDSSNTDKNIQTNVIKLGNILKGYSEGSCFISGSYTYKGNSYTADIDLDFIDFCYSEITLNGHSDLIVSEMTLSEFDCITYIGTYSGETDVTGEIEEKIKWDLTLNCSSGSLSVNGIITINNKDYDFKYESNL